MKKYVKPVMVRDEIEMNQAIAACSGGRQGYEAKYMGWCNLRAGGAEGTIYKTEDAASAVSTGWGGDNSYAACMCWDIWGTRQDGSYGHVAYYEDTNHSGTLDGGTTDWLDPTLEQGDDHWQNVWSLGNAAVSIFIS